MQVEHRIKVAAPCATVFQIYEEVDRWHEWDPDTKAATLDGPMRQGAQGKLAPTKGNAVPMLITQVVADRCFTVQSKIPLFCMVFEHELTPEPTGCEVVHRVTFSGLLSWVIGPMLSRQLNVGLSVTLGRLKQRAEQRAAA